MKDGEDCGWNQTCVGVVRMDRECGKGKDSWHSHTRESILDSKNQFLEINFCVILKSIIAPRIDSIVMRINFPFSFFVFHL